MAKRNQWKRFFFSKRFEVKRESLLYHKDWYMPFEDEIRVAETTRGGSAAMVPRRPTHRPTQRPGAHRPESLKRITIMGRKKSNVPHLSSQELWKLANKKIQVSVVLNELGKAKGKERRAKFVKENLGRTKIEKLHRGRATIISKPINATDNFFSNQTDQKLKVKTSQTARLPMPIMEELVEEEEEEEGKDEEDEEPTNEFHVQEFALLDEKEVTTLRNYHRVVKQRQTAGVGAMTTKAKRKEQKREGSHKRQTLISNLRGYYMQAADEEEYKDNELYSDTNLLKREALRFHPSVQHILADMCNVVDPKQSGQVSLKDFTKIYITVNKALSDIAGDPAPDKDLAILAEKEFYIDTLGSKTMDLQHFRQSWFQIADQWTEGINVEAYTAILKRFYVAAQLAMAPKVDQMTFNGLKSPELQPPPPPPSAEEKEKGKGKGKKEIEIKEKKKRDRKKNAAGGRSSDSTKINARRRPTMRKPETREQKRPPPKFEIQNVKPQTSDGKPQRSKAPKENKLNVLPKLGANSNAYLNDQGVDESFITQSRTTDSAPGLSPFGAYIMRKKSQHSQEDIKKIAEHCMSQLNEKKAQEEAPAPEITLKRQLRDIQKNKLPFLTSNGLPVSEAHYIKQKRSNSMERNPLVSSVDGAMKKDGIWETALTTKHDAQVALDKQMHQRVHLRAGGGAGVLVRGIRLAKRAKGRHHLNQLKTGASQLARLNNFRKGNHFPSPGSPGFTPGRLPDVVLPVANMKAHANVRRLQKRNI